MSKEEIVLSVNQLCKTIGKRKIVKDVSFEVKSGEIFGFLGPNGAGKTTTIRMLVGLIKPTSGEISIGGFHLRTQFLQAIRQVGCIVENPELYVYLTGRENLELFARMLDGVGKERIDEVIQLVELDHRIDETVKTYSLGMKQRLGIAQALLGNPRLLILDEPTNGLDPAGIRELRTFIRKLADDQGISVFISSHILHEIQLMSDRVAIIHEGTVLKTARVDQLVNQLSQVAWKIDPLEEGAKQLSMLPFVSHIEIQASKGQILTQMSHEKISETNQFLVDKQMQVMAIHPHQMTLEDIFLQITGSDPVV